MPRLRPGLFSEPAKSGRSILTASRPTATLWVLGNRRNVSGGTMGKWRKITTANRNPNNSPSINVAGQSVMVLGSSYLKPAPVGVGWNHRNPRLDTPLAL